MVEWRRNGVPIILLSISSPARTPAGSVSNSNVRSTETEDGGGVWQKVAMTKRNNTGRGKQSEQHASTVELRGSVVVTVRQHRQKDICPEEDRGWRLQRTESFMRSMTLLRMLKDLSCGE